MQVLFIKGQNLKDVVLQRTSVESLDRIGQTEIEITEVSSLVDGMEFLCERFPEVVVLDASDHSEPLDKVLRALQTLQPMSSFVVVTTEDKRGWLEEAQRRAITIALPPATCTSFNLLQAALFSYERQLLRMQVRLSSLKQKEAERLKDEILRNLSHEFLTPLNGIVGAADLMLMSTNSQEDREYLEISKNCAGQLLALVDNLLTLAGKPIQIKTARTTFCPSTIVTNVIEKWAKQANVNPDRIRFRKTSSVPPALQGDPEVIEVIINELLSNSAKFSAKDQPIELHLKSRPKSQGAELEFVVRDHGQGVSAKERQSLFAAFQQGDGSCTRVHGGLGVGMSLAKLAADRVGGRLSFESRPGAGTVFHAWLPFDVLETGEATTITTPFSQQGKVRELLLASADFSGQVELYHRLSAVGYKTHGTTNLGSLLDRLKDRRFDVLILNENLCNASPNSLIALMKEELGRAFPKTILIAKEESGASAADINLSSGTDFTELLFALSQLGVTPVIESDPG